MDFDLDLSIDVLRRTPPTLQALLGGVAEPWADWVPFMPVLTDHEVPRS